MKALNILSVLCVVLAAAATVWLWQGAHATAEERGATMNHNQPNTEQIGRASCRERV